MRSHDDDDSIGEDNTNNPHERSSQMPDRKAEEEKLLQQIRNAKANKE